MLHLGVSLYIVLAVLAGGYRFRVRFKDGYLIAGVTRFHYVTFY